ncbi:hypothetical protein [Dyadobacter sp. CY312]|uniref:hypothetical protein n=1 Tax=Dyadobacter sp. CY312 TaxID=2907303 RepID=UPI001F1BE2A5|nr:hypothetical protein [Dyadobacter sp. CY312]MCE7043109.1 hypothetical protein [Dyadobacter sp. CY312]
MMKQRLQAILYFYQSVGLVTGLISLTLWIIAQLPLSEDFQRFLPLYLILKAVTDFLLWRYLRKHHQVQLFFYTNLGISELRLYMSAFLLDLAAFFVVIAIIKLFLSI